jgi:urocanate hydratase
MGFHSQWWQRVGWGEVINGGFGMVLDGTKKHQTAPMLFWM